MFKISNYRNIKKNFMLKPVLFLVFLLILIHFCQSQKKLNKYNEKFSRALQSLKISESISPLYCNYSMYFSYAYRIEEFQIQSFKEKSLFTNLTCLNKTAKSLSGAIIKAISLNISVEELSWSKNPKKYIAKCQPEFNTEAVIQVIIIYFI